MHVLQSDFFLKKIPIPVLVKNKIVVGLYQCNCYILHCSKTREAVIIDPGDEFEELFVHLSKESLELKFIILTHAHLDHIMAVNQLADKTGAKVIMHPSDLFLAENIVLQSNILGIAPPDTRPLKINLPSKEGLEIAFGRQCLIVKHTPGHSPGSCSYISTEERELIFSGDTLFKGTVGRSDLWKGNHDELINSIQEKLLVYPNDTLILPGHGEETHVFFEKEVNPFLSR